MIQANYGESDGSMMSKDKLETHSERFVKFCNTDVRCNFLFSFPNNGSIISEIRLQQESEINFF